MPCAGAQLLIELGLNTGVNTERRRVACLGNSTLLLPCRGYIRLVLTGLMIVVATEARAGPPFITDDPEPTDTGHWEIYNYIQANQPFGVTTGQAGFDINYGGYKDLQLTAVLPADFEKATKPRLGLGDIELAAKYRFLHQSEATLVPDIAFFPRMFVPTSGRQFGSGRLGTFLPVWAQKDFGEWSIFGGGGYNINPGAGQRNFWQASAAVQRSVTDHLSLGVEVYHQTPDMVGTKPFSGINLGVTYKLIEHWSFLAAAGPLIQNARDGGRFDVYFALKADY
jgi:hypothetical protein